MSHDFSRWLAPEAGRRLQRGLCLFLCGWAAVQAETERVLAGSPLAGVVAQAVASSSPLAGNRLALIENGYDALLLRVHLIRAARKSISIQTFIWTNDECGRLLVCELIEAARRGVHVRILADQLFSERDPAIIAFIASAHPNLEVKHYRPAFARLDPSLWQTLLAGALSFRDVNQRMHNKVMLVDDAVLLTGGRNVENTYFDHATELNFRDRDVLAVGPVVREAVQSFEEFWRYRHAVPSRALRDVGAVLARGDFRRYPVREDYDFGPHFTALTREASDAALIHARFVARLRPVARVQFISDEPGKSRGYFSPAARSTRELRRMLLQARESVTLQTPYLVLSAAARDVFRKLQQERPGLRVRVSTNSFASTDNLLAYSGNYRLRGSYIEELHLAVHEFKPLPGALRLHCPRYDELARLAAPKLATGQQKRAPFLCLHAKSLVVDDAVAFVGSYNLDPRSERLNTEAGLLVEDAAFAQALRREIERDLAPENSWVIARREFPLHLDVVNGLVSGLLALSPLELWPIRNTSSFELRPGATAVPADHPDFYQNYREVGSFPGSDGLLSQKEILTRLYKAVGSPLTPVL